MNELVINLDFLESNSLSIEEYIVLLAYNTNDFSILKHVMYKGTFLGLLETKNYLKKDNDEFFITDKTRKLFGSKLDYSFESFWSDYPLKVPSSTGGYRVLKTKDLNSKQALECKAKYMKIAKIPGEDLKIKKGLENYLKNLRPTLQYCVGVEVFLNKKMYQKYYDIDDTPEKEKTERI